MACADWFANHGFTADSVAQMTVNSLNSLIYSDGVQCINNSQNFCSKYCADVTQNESECYACLSNPNTCPAANCRTSAVNCGVASNSTNACCVSTTGSCCPYAQSAVKCGACVAARGATGGVDDFVACFQTNQLSTTLIIVIAVSSAVAVGLAIAVIVTVVKMSRKRNAKNNLLRLARGKVDQETYSKLQNDLDFVDESAIHATSRALALGQ